MTRFPFSRVLVDLRQSNPPLPWWMYCMPRAPKTADLGSYFVPYDFPQEVYLVAIPQELNGDADADAQSVSICGLPSS